MKFKVIEISRLFSIGQDYQRDYLAKMWTKPKTQCPVDPGPKIIDFETSKSIGLSLLNTFQSRNRIIGNKDTMGFFKDTLSFLIGN